MARKQAKRRKQKKAQTFKMPKIRVGRIVAPLVAVGIDRGDVPASAWHARPHNFVDRDQRSVPARNGAAD